MSDTFRKALFRKSSLGGGFWKLCAPSHKDKVKSRHLARRRVKRLLKEELRNHLLCVEEEMVEQRKIDKQHMDDLYTLDMYDAFGDFLHDEELREQDDEPYDYYDHDLDDYDAFDAAWDD
jgi:hypothetical protein